MDVRWSFDRLSELQATPWSQREKPNLEVRFSETGAAPERRARDEIPLPRAFRITYGDLVEHGFTVECPQCMYNEQNQRSKPGISHSNICRQRLLDALLSTPAGRRRFEAYEEKIDQAIADRGPEYEWRLGGAGSGRAAAMGADGSGVARHATDPAQPRPSSTATTATDDIAPVVPERPVPEQTGGSSASGYQAPRDAHGRVRGAMGAPSDEAPAETRGAGPQRVDTPYGGYTSMDDYCPPGPNAGDVDMDMGMVDGYGDDCDEISSVILEHLGFAGRSRERDRRRAIKRLVSEIYSPPRIILEIMRSTFRNLTPGLALDLTVNDPDDGMPWDFSLKSKRTKARELLQHSRPVLLIGSPMCTAFCTWQRFNAVRSARPEDMKRAYTEACVHIEFVMELYRDQMARNLYFLHEHPKFASSWSLKSVQQLSRAPGVAIVRGDQCQYGAEAPHGAFKGSPVMKPTGFMSNSPEILRELSKRCNPGPGSMCSRPEGGQHTACAGGICKEMAKYPRPLCRAVLRGLTAQLRIDGRLQDGCYGLQLPEEPQGVQKYLYGPAQGYSGKFKDDLTGQVLRDDLVLEARAKEMKFFADKQVWIKVPRQRAHQRTGKPPISVRWVDTNKADEVEPNYRSRLVARQLKACDSSGASYFAPAPPLEALRTIISLAMTRCGSHQPIWDPDSPQRQQISCLDVRRAYFNAKVDREASPSFVDLPPEDPDRGKMCGELLRHMYGTRPAADGWQEEYSTLLVRLGFTQGKGSANVFRHDAQKISCSVHGDDFIATGPADALDWYEGAVASEYEIAVGPRLGPGPKDAKEARVLNRVITWHSDRIEYEADPRQAERLIDECGFSGTTNSMATPGVKNSYQEFETDEPLEEKLHTPFRGSAARGNYLSADRIDIQFAAKEICRSMALPTSLSWRALKRLSRYLSGKPRLVYVYRRQVLDTIDVYVDTDWAGCTRTRKSTSGGVVMLGRHTIKHWSSTQPNVALSSGEAEFYGVVHGAGHGLGYQALLADLGVAVPLRVWTDSSAALGICSRQGLGKLRHLDTHTLWVQQAVRSRRVELKHCAWSGESCGSPDKAQSHARTR